MHVMGETVMGMTALTGSVNFCWSGFERMSQVGACTSLLYFILLFDVWLQLPTSCSTLFFAQAHTDTSNTKRWRYIIWTRNVCLLSYLLRSPIFNNLSISLLASIFIHQLCSGKHYNLEKYPKLWSQLLFFFFTVAFCSRMFRWLTSICLFLLVSF